MIKSVLKLGTRKSLLAWAQSTWVAQEVEQRNPGVKVELMGIETRGDRILDVSLRNVEGKEFFVAEIDEALRGGKVDFTVHSMKDLSLERPSEFVCAAIPKRENPRDILIFSPNIEDRLRSGETLKIGTSSPRRIENIPGFLDKALPRYESSGSRRSTVEFIEIRGNVNTRLGRIHQPVGSDRYLDGVVLAFAGLIRLWAYPEGREELQKLLYPTNNTNKMTRWMILPLRECPAAPAQGALAIECQSSNEHVKHCLSKMHDGESSRLVAQERQLLEDWGGGCHQRFGATAFHSSELGDLLFIRGSKMNGEKVEEVRRQLPLTDPTAKFEQEEGHSSFWDGAYWKPRSSSMSVQADSRCELRDRFAGRALFIAHSRAAESYRNSATFESARVWTSGTASWFRLAAQGIWVEGCAEGFGFNVLRETLAEGLLQLPALMDWAILTHSEAIDDWKDECKQVLSTYSVNSSYDVAAIEGLKTARYLFWSSGSQFDALKEYCDSGAHHSCGPGKTAARLKREGLSPSLFLSAEEWRKWLKQIL